MIRTLIIAATLAAIPSIATAQTYSRATFGVAVNGPKERDFLRTDKRNPFTIRVETEEDAPTLDVAVGKDLGDFRLEANLGGSAFAGGRAGCIDCPGGNPGSNGKGPYGPEMQRGYVWVGTGTLNALADLPATDRLTLSAGGGIGGAYLKPDTGERRKQGQRQVGDSFGFMWKGIGEARYRIGRRTQATVRVTHEDLGNRRVHFASERGTVLASVNEPVRYQTATVGITYNFGGE